MVSTGPDGGDERNRTVSWREDKGGSERGKAGMKGVREGLLRAQISWEVRQKRKTVREYIPIMIDPLLAGERKPITEHRIIKKAQIINCMPVPTMTYIKFTKRSEEIWCKMDEKQGDVTY